MNHAFYVGAIAVIGIVMFCLGLLVSESNTLHDCKKFGQISLAEKVYECTPKDQHA